MRRRPSKSCSITHWLPTRMGLRRTISVQQQIRFTTRSVSDSAAKPHTPRNADNSPYPPEGHHVLLGDSEICKFYRFGRRLLLATSPLEIRNLRTLDSGAPEIRHSDGFGCQL